MTARLLLYFLQAVSFLFSLWNHLVQLLQLILNEPVFQQQQILSKLYKKLMIELKIWN